MTSLYICYQSVLEPLTQTQVIAYLEGLAASGYGIVLLTFEPKSLGIRETREWQTRLAQKGILWYWTRYHKRPTVPATAWDVAAGTLIVAGLVRKYHVSLVHARAHVAGLMAYFAKRLLGVRFLLDLRGFMAEEYVDAGSWQANGVLFRVTKRAEQTLVNEADGIVVLTEAAREELRSWYPSEMRGKLVDVIPCCVDLRRIPRARLAEQRKVRNGARRLVYAGKLGGWYPVKEMVAFFVVAKRMAPQLEWYVWTQSDPGELRTIVAAERLDEDVHIGQLPPEALSTELVKADAGLCLYKRGLSAAGCSPTKLSEYLGAGLPVVVTSGVGDVEAVLDSAPAPVGVPIRGYSDRAFEEAFTSLQTLLDDPATPDRCREVAEERFDLERVGWTRYRQLYSQLMSL